MTVSAEPEQNLSMPAPLRIVFLSRALPVHRFGGLEYHLRDLSAGLARRGHEIHILTTAGGAGEPIGAGIAVHELPGSKPGNYSFGFFRRIGDAARKLCRQVNADLVCPVDLSGLFLNPADFSAAVVPIIHGTLTSEVPLDWRYWSNLPYPNKLRVFWRYKTRLGLIKPFKSMIQRVDHIMVDSEFTRRELFLNGAQRLLGTPAWASGIQAVELSRKIHVVQLGIDVQRYPEPVAEEKHFHSGKQLRICTLGRLQEIKGVGQAIRAAAALKARGVDFHLSIGGTGEYAEAASVLIKKLRVRDTVSLDGRIAPESLAGWFHRHDLFLFPDLTQPAFGLVAVEAMRFGLPVVAARVGAIPEVVTETCGWLYDPWDVNELAGLLMHLAANSSEVEAKASCAKTEYERFTAERMADRTEKTFYTILGLT